MKDRKNDNEPWSITYSTGLQHAYIQHLFQSINGCYVHSTPIWNTTRGWRWLFVFPMLFCDLVLVWNSILGVHGIMSPDKSRKVLLVMQVLKSRQGNRDSLCAQPITETAGWNAEQIHREADYLFKEQQGSI